MPKYVGLEITYVHDQLIMSLQHSFHGIVKYFDNRNYSLCCVVTASVHDNLFKVCNIQIMQEKGGWQRLLEYFGHHDKRLGFFFIVECLLHVK